MDGFRPSLLLFNRGRPEEDEEGVVLTRWINGQRGFLSDGEEYAAPTPEILQSRRATNLLPSSPTRHPLNWARNWREKLDSPGGKDAHTTWVPWPNLFKPQVKEYVRRIKITINFVIQARSGYTVQFDCTKIRSETGPASCQAGSGSLQTWQELVSFINSYFFTYLQMRQNSA